ncbi:isoaspartyl dipeptidase [Thermincola ferriacetica]|uniref:Isoaspartyl dipeptidase n=1 Tax=Thermincola ferriacetica TaxID=281456 RepID=A0A0L6W6S8_9FIRM|nr:beta-aspartyl-peptidase [Thermincola ferriacetica]KNZ71225.1 isoaspartyl dipeptidase [Thermincola ferriacetica]
MFTVIRNGHLFAPEDMGKVDILICAGKIIHIGALINVSGLPLETKIIAADNMYVVPGFIDQHVHIAGGGGEAGPASRTPEIKLHQLTTNGITTVVGLLGVDGVSRSVAGLLAKARGLEQEGISTYIYTGAYEIPTRTFTDSLRSDLVLIDKVIGCGEIAISDHRSAQPTLEMLAKLGAEARVGGILSGKAGIVHVHVGEGKKGLQLLFDVINNTDLPITQFNPTHTNRLDRLFYQAIDYALKGGYIDLTAGINPRDDGPRVLHVVQAVKYLIDAKVNLKQITVSSDGNGSLPHFDSAGNMESISVGSVEVLWKDVRELIKQNILSFPEAISLITCNVAALLKLAGKGKVKVGYDADLVLLDKDLNIDTVIAGGKVMVQCGQALEKGYFKEAAFQTTS